MRKRKKKTQLQRVMGWANLLSAYLQYSAVAPILRNNVLNGSMLVRCLADAVPVASFASQMIPWYGT